jgi:hypothetical protein
MKPLWSRSPARADSEYLRNIDRFARRKMKPDNKYHRPEGQLLFSILFEVTRRQLIVLESWHTSLAIKERFPD